MHQTRLKEAQEKCTPAYNKMVVRFESINNRDILENYILKFFELAESYTEDQLQKLREQLREQSFPIDEMKEMCKDLCKEAVNRDFCSYVSNGDPECFQNKSIGNAVYKLLV